MEAAVDAIVQEQGEKICFGTDPSQTLRGPDINESPLPQVSIQLVQDTCRSIAEDPLLPENFRQLVQELNCADLHNALGFLKECLVPRRSFRDAATERAWANYHVAYMQASKSVSEITKSEKIAAWISLHVFKKLVAEAYSWKKEAPEALLPVLEEEKCTIRYIGESVVKKIKQKVLELAKNDHGESEIEALNALVCHPGGTEVVETDMTALDDRDDLAYIKPEIAQMFFSAEAIFRKLAGTGSADNQVSAQDFVKACMGDDDITSCFYKALYECEMTIPTEVMESILAKILQLFFETRIHHKVTTIMDKILFRENKSKKGKGSRKRLKKSQN